jgi:hypothetical protein
VLATASLASSAYIFVVVLSRYRDGRENYTDSLKLGKTRVPDARRFTAWHAEFFDLSQLGSLRKAVPSGG